MKYKLQITVRIEWATWMKLTERRRRETQCTKRGTSGKDLWGVGIRNRDYHLHHNHNHNLSFSASFLFFSHFPHHYFLTLSIRAALQHYKEAVRINPNCAVYHNNRYKRTILMFLFVCLWFVACTWELVQSVPSITARGRILSYVREFARVYWCLCVWLKK